MFEIKPHSQDRNFEGEDIVCYCFGYTRADLEKDCRVNKSHSTIFDKITAEKKAGTCDCAQKNPQGR
jgi:NADPH-dependent 7-cyano-7-deazaguanine reductase QueF